MTRHYTELFWADTATLALLPADRWPKATDYMAAMIDFATRLEQTGHAYRLPQGLYFDTSSINGYGAMATMGRDTDAATARIDTVEGKRQRADFALWRSFPDDADDQPWVGWWMHGEFVQFEGDKMSKSKGNVMDVDDVVDLGVDPIAYKLLLLASHYRSQVTVGPATLTAAGNRYRRLVDTARRRLDTTPGPDTDRPIVDAATVLDQLAPGTTARRIVEQMDDAIADDLATPRVLVQLDTALDDPTITSHELLAVLETARSLLGIDLHHAAAAARTPGVELDTQTLDAIRELIDEREDARRNRRYDRADELRNQLLDQYGVAITDTPGGPRWEQRTASVTD